MGTAAIVTVVFLGLAALIGGGVLALLASRSAPEGFEDHEGFHVGSTPPASKAKVTPRV